MRSLAFQWGVWLVGCASLFVSFAALARSACDGSLLPVDSHVGYKWRASQDLCEGLYKKPVSAKLDVVSVLAGKLNYDTHVHDSLEIAVHDPALVEAEVVNIRAISLPLKTYYRMDAQLPKQAAIDWSLTTVVKPERLEHSDIGLFGWTETSAKRLYVPLRVRNGGEGDEAADVSIIVKIRAHQKFASIVWRTSAEGRVDTRGMEARQSPDQSWSDHLDLASGWPAADDAPRGSSRGSRIQSLGFDNGSHPATSKMRKGLRRELKRRRAAEGRACREVPEPGCAFRAACGGHRAHRRLRRDPRSPARRSRRAARCRNRRGDPLYGSRRLRLDDPYAIDPGGAQREVLDGITDPDEGLETGPAAHALGPGGIQLEAIPELVVPLGGRRATLKDDVTAGLEATHLSMTGLSFGEGTRLTFEQSESGRLDLFVLEGAATGSLLAQGETKIDIDAEGVSAEDQPHQYEIPEEVRFDATATKGDPARIYMSRRSPFRPELPPSPGDFVPGR